MGEDDHLDGESLKDDLLIRNVNLTVLLEYIEVGTCTRRGRVQFACACIRDIGIPVQNLWQRGIDTTLLRLQSRYKPVKPTI